MADTFTTDGVGAILMGIGGDNNTWGTNLNNSAIQVFADALANALVTNASAGALGPSNTLDLSPNPPPAAPSAARYGRLIFAGAITANQIVKVPNLTKWWFVHNNTTGAFTVSFQTPSGTPVVVPQGFGGQIVHCNGSNGIFVSPFGYSQVQMPDGSAGAPVYSNVNEPASGWYRNGTQDWRLAINGADVLQVTGAGAGSPSVVNILGPNSLQVAGTSIGAFTTGDVKLTFKTAADAGWVMMNDSTIGDASSNATYANANASALWQLLYNNISDADAPILTSGGAATTRGAQGSAATAFANHCRLTLPLVLGRALAAAGSGAGLTSRTLGHALGEEAHQLTTGEIPAHTHNYSGTTGNESQKHTHSVPAGGANNGNAQLTGSNGPLQQAAQTTGTDSVDHTHPYSGTTDNGGLGGGAHNTMQPTVFLNVMIKL